jgi:2,5-diamino-6-(ribosylamino)-4(3H)-pyrimidinone 5'-phosphate reductase
MRPCIILSNAISPNGSLTGYGVDYGVYYPLLLSYHPDAVLVGADTVLAASVAIPPEEAGDFRKRPDRPDETRLWWVVVDSRGRLARILHFSQRMEYTRDIIVLVSEKTPDWYSRYLREREYEYLVAGRDRVNLCLAMENLFSGYDIRILVSDTGGSLDTALLESGLVDDLKLKRICGCRGRVCAPGV